MTPAGHPPTQYVGRQQQTFLFHHSDNMQLEIFVAPVLVPWKKLPNQRRARIPAVPTLVGGGDIGPMVSISRWQPSP